MKNGSKKSLKATDLTTIKPKGPGKGGASLQERGSRKARLAALDPIPPEAAAAPVEWAEKHIESLAPDAAKEVEYAMKFGSDTMRYNASLAALAMKGLTTKPKEQGVIAQAMVFVNTGPVMASGAPALPFMNGAPVLDAPKTPVTLPPNAALATKGDK